MGIEAVKIAPRSPWQNPYCERVIGSIRPDVIVRNERHLRRVLQAYMDYYHHWRTHRVVVYSRRKFRLIRVFGTDNYAWFPTSRRE